MTTTTITAYLGGLRTINPLNRREHHWARHRRVQREREEADLLLSTALDLRALEKARVRRVLFVRVAPRKLDEGDNLGASMKSVRDQLCDLLGINDGPSAGIRWEYGQEKGKAREYGVRVEIEVEAGT